mmetsp:Transcript_3823/g.8537  ORF Transcript_3823/g.8537 Transcript_3823/m.8537 type:complete len:1220 (+) Transcript_3823:92-3751(+)|eukprot:CAMPEP_0172308018 /NCGR_PEP_ID=MMETSP1058-20130122/8744_1 /TAXON_ID=83371 /ORGANISM="Detonula confervacea, Strain CCMP 353" /LENGTH=1219 /DNA_ID=CAMNT_0013020347 /DNA_START=12 /DNA_END=3671 /DNA_ORIENTATION=+
MKLFNRLNRQSSRNLTLSDWDNTQEDHVEEELPSKTTSCSGGSHPDATATAPAMNLQSVYETLDNNRNNQTANEEDNDLNDDVVCHVSHDEAPPMVAHSASRRRTTISKMFDRRPSDYTVAMTSSSSASQKSSSYSSTAGTNIWTKLLAGGGKAGDDDGLWDSLNGKDIFEDEEDDDSDGEGGGGIKDTARRGRSTMERCRLAWWYETKHFVATVWKHPHIWIISLATFGILCGTMIAAVNGEKNTHVQKQKMTAEFIARETGTWFANEFRKAMLPLYSVQQSVIHSGYFNDAAEQIGPYQIGSSINPNVIPETMNQTNIMRDVTGICDDGALQEKWRDIVKPINDDNDLEGVVFGYRLAPKNVFCLFERPPPMGDKNFGLDAGSSSQNGFWKSITEGIFIEREYAIFGPFEPMPDSGKEWFCGHLPIWTKSKEILNVQGVQVEGAWGFVMNYLDWAMLKDRSNIYERFAECNLDFELTRIASPRIPGKDSQALASSPHADLLDSTNSVLIKTDSLHGVWENRVGNLAGWSPPWYNGAISGVVLVSLLLGFLTASTLVERQLHRNLVAKMLPRRAIVKLHRGQTVLEKYNLVTIFFSDIVGFTSMAGSMRPIQVMKMLNDLYTELDKLVLKHQVYKVETIGDAYMVVGGAPDRVPAPLAAERVALFALDVVAFVKKFRTNDGDQIFIRAGIASGPTVGGVVGQAMPRYCFFGDTVNFASRMESTSKKMNIQVAEVTYRLLQDTPTMEFNLTKRMEGDIAGVMIKGKGHQITYWLGSASQREVCPKKRWSFDRKRTHSMDIEAPASASQELANVDEDDVSEQPEHINMYSQSEIYDAMTNQDWEKLGHASASSGLVAASDDRDIIIVRASALLEHHLLRVLKERNADATISISIKVQINKFVADVAATYNDVHFHNLSHAIHVTTSMNKLLSATVKEDPSNSFALVFSALLHDAGHTGMSNKFLIDSRHALSKKYGKDVPIAEKQSIDIALEILFRPEYETMRKSIIPGDLDKVHFAKDLFQSILVTDIASPDCVKLGLKRYEVSQDEHGEYDSGLCPLACYIEDVFEGVDLDEGVKEEYPEEFIITHTGLQGCVRNEHLMLLSDISHLLQSWENFVKWNFRLYKEINVCFKQGLGNDPRGGWCQGQIGFLDHYILPLAKRSHIYFNKEFADALVKNGLNNRRLWMEHGIKATSIIVDGADNDEVESDVLLRLNELSSGF